MIDKSVKTYKSDNLSQHGKFTNQIINFIGINNFFLKLLCYLII